MTKSVPSGSAGKKFTCQCRRRRFDSWVRKIPWRRKWQFTPVFLPGKFHGQRSLAGCSPWGHKESDMTEHARIISPWGHKESDTTEHARIIMIVKGLKSLSVKVM